MRYVTTGVYHDTIKRQQERMARARIEASQRHGKACGQIDACAAEADAKPLPASASDGEIAAAADRRAARMGERIAGLSALLDDGAMLSAINAWLIEAGARAFLPVCRWVARLRGVLARVQAPEWWRRQLRRDVIRRAEAERIAAGQVGAPVGQWYASDETVRRRILQQRRNADILQRTELENEAGEVWTLAALAAKGTANKAIRRGELMTRIRGCEEWAEAEGHRGVFLTLTVPSRFHATLYAGGANPRYEGATPRDAQDWLNRQWARARARLARIGVEAYGFRVAEPHHDGCPHWHALVWVPPGQVWRMVRALKRHWLSDAGDEPGARAHRVKAVMMRGGEASGYVAKYIAKNIDDAGSVGEEGHADPDKWGAVEREAEGFKLQRELFANPAARVEAWASAWGIRQFQAIGQPPVTVWRELRRVPRDAVEVERAPRVAFVLDAVSRDDERRACWFTFLDMSGGTNTGADYLLRIAKRRDLVEGRFEAVERATPLGVYEAGRPEVIAPSVRRQWKPRGANADRFTSGPAHGVVLRGDASEGVPAARAVGAEGRALRGVGAQGVTRSAAPWTRVNNCTQQAPRRWLPGLAIPLAMPLDGMRGGLREWAGGLHRGQAARPRRPSGRR